ncbi:MAG: class I SAM-dependent methyltransferase [Ignavibacteriae bacterium]|nr:class I SAM-dependent methyltransferase [Ignavibacteriota bacterium]
MHISTLRWEEFYGLLAQQSNRLIDPSTGKVLEQWVHTIACPICGSADYTLRVFRSGFQYVTCNRCALVYINPQLTQEAITTVYNDEAVRKFFFEQLLLPFVERDQQPEFHARARELRSMVSTSQPRLLDIGSAAGNFLLIAQQHGFIGEGLELNELYLDFINKNRKLTVYNKLLEDMKYPNATFDVVTLWDVLEHLPQPCQTVAEISRILRPQGLIALTTINHRCFNEKILKERWRYYTPPDHLCSFTPGVLKNLLNQCGFTNVTIRHHYMFEVLAEHYFRFALPPSERDSVNLFIKKAKKILYLLLTRGSEAIMNTLRSGDLLTVYARKD